MTEVEVRELRKEYDGHVAVDGLGFSIETGKIYGFLGPNGAGKSTTMNMITGCLAPTEGTVLIQGHDIYEEQKEAKRHIGYLPEIPPLYMDMTPAEYLRFVCEIKHIPAAERASAIEDVLCRTGTEGVKNRLIRQLSKGYRQRVGIAQALVGYPETIILDEPTVGLDPLQIIEIRELIRELGKKHTVLLSSHILTEVSELCDEVIIIAGGKLIARDTPERLAALTSGGMHLHLSVPGPEEKVQEILHCIPAVREITCAAGEEGETAVSVLASEDCRSDIFFAFADAKMALHEMKVEHTSLEQIFLDYMETAGEVKNGNGSNI